MKFLDTLASSTVKIDAGNTGIPNVDPNAALVGILNTVYLVAGIVAVVVIIVAGIIFTTSAGDSGNVKLARESIIYAVVGLVVIMSAFVITGFVVGSF